MQEGRSESVLGTERTSISDWGGGSLFGGWPNLFHLTSSASKWRDNICCWKKRFKCFLWHLLIFIPPDLLSANSQYRFLLYDSHKISGWRSDHIRTSPRFMLSVKSCVEKAQHLHQQWRGVTNKSAGKLKIIQFFFFLEKLFKLMCLNKLCPAQIRWNKPRINDPITGSAILSIFF